MRVPVLLVTATGREAEAAVAGDRRSAGRRQRRAVPVLGDAAARTAFAARRHRRPTAGDAAPARPPGTAPGGLSGRRGRDHPVDDPADGARTWARWRRSPSRRAGGRPHRRWSNSSSSLAYTRVDMVEKRGEIAVRGGILDVFPPTADHPVRVEFFGDEITDIRTFGVIDQRSLAAVEDGHRAAVPGDPADAGGPGPRGRPVGARTPATRRWPRCSTTWRTGSPSKAWNR